MPKLRALIVDDEPLARDRLRLLLAAEPTVEIIGECGDGPSAVAAIREQAPDVVFLDIEMPGCNGLQVLARLTPDHRPAVIFVTAYERFALEAFNVRAVDYLLKPFDRERFHVALERAEEHLRLQRPGGWSRPPEHPAPEAPPARPPDRLAVKTDGRVVFVRLDEIEWIEAADNYVVVHANQANLVARETLSALEAQLGPTQFARINRSALVRLDQVKELRPAFHGDYVVVLRNGTRLPLSRSLRTKFGQLIAPSL